MIEARQARWRLTEGLEGETVLSVPIGINEETHNWEQPLDNREAG